MFFSFIFKESYRNSLSPMVTNIHPDFENNTLGKLLQLWSLIVLSDYAVLKFVWMFLLQLSSHSHRLDHSKVSLPVQPLEAIVDCLELTHQLVPKKMIRELVAFQQVVKHFNTHSPQASFASKNLSYRKCVVKISSFVLRMQNPNYAHLLHLTRSWLELRPRLMFVDSLPSSIWTACSFTWKSFRL